ncbi:MAG: hypothetical protein QXW00_02750 [Candidatus Woesearchaeota archaeon]
MGRKTHKQRLKGTPRWVTEQKEFEMRTGRFPECKGTFPDCPEEVNEKTKREEAPEVCRKCPKFR